MPDDFTFRAVAEAGFAEIGRGGHRRHVMRLVLD
jgi:hypothetical protein